ncbi:hypothetical protein XENOCAPTIV_017466 [Xenoophorus captivus]|uniref:Uncharacterized protein n=1 Tax=Xenoophorus captivus TaxID=1517983 RepID=A0ABV0RJJ1_9TELE
MNTGVEESGCSNRCAFIWVVASQEVRSYPVSWLFQKKVNALYFEKFQKSSYQSLMLKSMAGSQHEHRQAHHNRETQRNRCYGLSAQQKQRVLCKHVSKTRLNSLLFCFREI